MKNLETAMRVATSSAFGFYLKVHSAHLNIVGPNFFEYHKLLEMIYKDIWDSYDTWAEQMRALDMLAPAGIEEFQMLSIVKDNNPKLSPQEMIYDLLIDNGRLIDLFCGVNALALPHPGLQNFIQSRIDTHAKWSWMLRSTIQKEV